MESAQTVGITVPNAEKLCIVCPHSQDKHTERYDQCWCTECNKDDNSSGPCSFYFMARHKYQPRPPLNLECIKCKLNEDSMAHAI